MTKTLVLLTLLIVCNVVSAKQSANVLLLNSYHPQYRWTDELTHGVRDALHDAVATENLHVEFMDARRYVDDKAYEQKLIELLKYKYRSYKPDVVITSDDHAYYFMVEQGKALFGDTPIVFCGVNVFYPDTLQGRNNITGIKEGMEIRGNLDLIITLQPQVKKIVMLGDTTGLGLRMVESAKRIRQRWQTKQVQLEIWDSFTLEELYQKAEKIEPDSAFLMMAIHKDKAGKYFSFENELPILSKRANAPVYGMWGALMIGNGAIGGMMNNPYQHGFNAAKMAVQIINGTDVAQLPIKDKAEFSPFFDYQQLRRFNIDLNLLPENSVVVGAPVGLYEQHRELIHSVIGLFIALVGVITLLLNNIRQRKAAQTQLRLFNQQLEVTVQERTKDLEEQNQALEEASLRLIEMANTDFLTQLGNRGAAKSEIEGYVKRYNVDFKPLALAILDIDFFKKINDTYGHQAGDDVLVVLAQTLRDDIRPSDRAYRWGGEEFLIMLPDTDSKIAERVCQRIREKILQISTEDVPKLSASIGLASFQLGDSYDVLLKRADEALYVAKSRGRNQVVVV